MKRTLHIALLCLAGIICGSWVTAVPEYPETEAKSLQISEAEDYTFAGGRFPEIREEASDHLRLPYESGRTRPPGIGNLSYRRLFHGALLLAALAFTRCITLSLKLREVRQNFALPQRPVPDPVPGETEVKPAIPVMPGRSSVKRDGIANGIRRVVFEQEGYRDPDMTVTALADRLGVNRNDLSRAINENTGKHFNHWLNEIRIREAACRLAENGRKYNITEIAYETGFNDRTTFFRAFKKITGCSPSEFCRSVYAAKCKQTTE